jgi:hypothetical protein
MPLLAILIPVLLGHVGISAALAAVTVPEWIAVAAALIKAAPDVINGLTRLHPALEALTTELARGHPPEHAARAAHTAAQAALQPANQTIQDQGIKESLG